MASIFTPTGAYSNLTRLELEQLRRGDYTAGGKALTIGDSGLLPEGVIGPGSVNAEPFFSAAYSTLQELLGLDPVSEPGKYLGKRYEVYPNGDLGAWLGPDEIVRVFGATAVNTNATQISDPGADYVVDGVQAGDLVLIYVGASGLTFATATVSVVNSPTLITCSNILLSGGGTSFPGGGAAISEYAIVRPNAVQLFAVPGSGPLGQEQTFLFVDPASTLHSNPSPTLDLINADRIPNIIPPKYNKNSTVDRSDAVYRAPAPGAALDNHGYRVILYPDNGAGSPDLTSPITSLNPVIDPAIPTADQRMTIDYSAGAVRFSCAPAIGGDIKVPGGVDAGSGRLNLYAVAWCYLRTPENGASAYRLYEPTATATATGYPAQVKWESPTWAIRGLKADGGQSLIKVAGNTAANQQLRILEVEQPNAASIVGKLNAQVVTVGNGTTTFGDYNGASAIEDAWSASSGNLTIRVKAGTYLLTGIIDAGGSDVTIIGESVNTVILNVDLPTTTAITAGPNGKLTLENLQVRRNTATTSRIQVGGMFRARNCLFRSTYLWITTPGTTSYPAGVGSFVLGEDSVVVEDCVIDGSAASDVSPIQFLIEDNVVVRGFRFRNCIIRGPDTGDACVLVTNGLTVAFGTLTDVTFEQCQFQPHACASSSSTVIAKPSGVFYVDPGVGATDMLIVDEISFDDCDVTIATNGAAVGNTILMNLGFLAYNATTTNDRALIGTVRIRGGRWEVPLGRGTDFTPFFLQCFFPIVENVQFVGGNTATNSFGTAPGYRGNGVYTDAQKIALRGAAAPIPNVNTTPQGWLTIAASGNGIEAVASLSTQQLFRRGMKVQGVHLGKLNRLAGTTGGVVLVGPNLPATPLDVNGVTVFATTGTSGTNTNLVGYWYALMCGGAGSSRRGNNGWYRGLSFQTEASNGGILTATDRWGDAGIMFIEALGPVNVDGLDLSPDLVGTNDPASTGILIGHTWYSGSPFAVNGTVRIYNSTIRNVRTGIRALTFGYSALFGPFDFQGVRIIHSPALGSSSSNAPLYGIYMDASSTNGFEAINIQNCHVAGFHFNGDDYQAYYFTQATWNRAYRHTFIGNSCYMDVGANFLSATGAGVWILSNNGSSVPNWAIYGNNIQSTVGGFPSTSHYIALQRTSALALVDNSKGGGGSYLGAETGHSITNTGQYRYVSSDSMVHNNAILKTP